MRRPTINLLIDLLAALLFLGMLATGYILYFSLPPGTNKTLSLWSLTRHEWGRFHFWMSAGFLGVLLVHVALHWSWVVAIVRRRFNREAAAGARSLPSGVIALGVLAAVVGLFAWVTEVSVREQQGAAVVPVAVGLDSAASAEARPLPPGPSRAGDTRIDFWGQVYPILARSCLACHGPTRAHGNFRVDRRDDYFGGPDRVAHIASGRCAASPLIEIVRGERPGMDMAAHHVLPEQEVDTLCSWIDAGAEWPDRE